MIKRHLRTAIAALAALALAIPFLATAPGAHAAWQDSPEVKTLYEAAKKEGKVIVWGTQRREVEWIRVTPRIMTGRVHGRQRLTPANAS